MGAALSRRGLVIERLRRGPATTDELARAAGYEAGSDAGRAYARVTVRRLAECGYCVVNLRPPGSHRGAYYVLMSRPRARSESTCQHCGCHLRRGNPGPLCDPCAGARAREGELPWPRLLTLYDPRRFGVAS